MQGLSTGTGLKDHYIAFREHSDMQCHELLESLRKRIQGSYEM